ncbi:MAG: septum formation initiator family protein [Lachnospiraceae bacterium]|nr:septum formation initiator family protein [Lachnospiraceae bacterium]MDD6192612.1 septum formation initiator family protein [Lachnospiraceae bacterium]MDY4792576.1 septum formation initiator family protein [Pararoseburia sp.]
MKKQKRKKRKSNTGRISILCIGIFLIMVFSIQMVRLYQKNQEYVKQEQALNEQVKDLKKEKEDLSEYEEYIKSDEYVEDTAKKKLGLIFDNEIIFREK